MKNTLYTLPGKTGLLIALVFFLSACSKPTNEPQLPATFSITSFSPSSGVPGDTVSILGSGFSTTPGAITVKLNQKNAFVVGVAPDKIRFIIPAGATTGKISLTSDSNTLLSAVDFTILPYVSTFAGSGAAAFADGAGINASFQNPTDLVLDSAGNIYITDSQNFRIRKIDSNGIVTTIAGSGSQGFADGTGSAASFGIMLGIGIDKSNNFLYVADLGNHSIRKVSLTGVVTTIAGQGFSGYVDGSANIAEFRLPMGVALDEQDNIYVADAGNNCIRKISNTGIVSTIAGNLTPGNVNGSGNIARFNNPIRVKLKSNGDLVVLDQNNHSIRLVTPAGLVTTIAGTGTYGFSDGPVSTAQFSAPTGVYLDQSGNIYIGDQLNNRVRKITASGMVTTVAGSGIQGYMDGPVNTAKFNRPVGLDMNSKGIYVVDNPGNRIRLIHL